MIAVCFYCKKGIGVTQEKFRELVTTKARENEGICPKGNFKNQKHRWIERSGGEDK